jgi:hypothetical protein
VRHFAAGVVAALGVLLRPDGILLIPPLVVAVWLLKRDRQARLRLGGWMLAGFVIFFSPWPIRNMVQFHRPWFLGTRVDRFSAPVPNYSGYYAWLTTWATEQEVQPMVAWCFYDPTCAPNIVAYPVWAFDNIEEHAEVDRLLGLRRKELFSERVSDGFTALANRRRLHHPIDNLILLPAKRAWNVWMNNHADVMYNRVPWPDVMNPIKKAGKAIHIVFCALMIFSAWLLYRRKEARRLTAVLACAIAVRTLFLAYFFYVEPRYTVEVMPLGFVLLAGAAAIGIERSQERKAQNA